MLPSMKDLRERLQGAGPKVLDETIALAGVQAALCARYGYGLTVKCEDDAYFFHLPDIATDSGQASLLEKAAFPDEDSLLRLRRRIRPGMIILEACAGYGLRTVFYARSMKAARVYALNRTDRGLALSRKNIVLNSLENVHQASWAGMYGDAAASGTGSETGSKTGSVDDFCRSRKIEHLDLISLDKPGLAYATLEGAAATLRRDGPAIIVWGQWGEESAGTGAFLKSLGYGEPEAWTPDVAFWVSRL